MTAPLLEEEEEEVLEGVAADVVPEGEEEETKGFESDEIDAVVGLNLNWR